MTESNEERPEHEAEPRQPSRDEQWEREILAKLAFAGLKEQRRARRWGIFFKSVSLMFMLAFLLVITAPQWKEKAVPAGKHTALVDMSGIIAPDAKANADRIGDSLEAAFAHKNTAGVILRINSPGGSPVQSGYLFDEIQQLREQHPDIPLHVVVGDICASGGYYVAAAADQIFANRASIVGSIGVRMGGFGFVDAMEKLGVERRLMTAGENKALGDPFSPVDQEEQAHLQGMLDDIHQQFIDAVKTGRGDRLADDPRLFSGLVWTGQQSVDLGLVDGLGDADYVAREVIGQERIVDFTQQEDWLRELSRRVDAAVEAGISALVAEKAPIQARM